MKSHMKIMERGRKDVSTDPGWLAVCSELPKAKRWLEYASGIRPLLQARMSDASALPGVSDLISLVGL